MWSNLWKRFANRETILYLIFGVLTTLVDWVSYALFRTVEIDYRAATILSWAAAVLFAFVTNKFFVFCSFEITLIKLWKEFAAFVSCRLMTGILTTIGMVVMVDFFHMNEYMGKVVVSAISLVLNYVFSKLFIFKKRMDRGAK